MTHLWIFSKADFPDQCYQCESVVKVCLFLFSTDQCYPCRSVVGFCFSLAAALLQLIHHAIEIRIAGAKASCEPVSTALRYFLAIGQHVKLAGLARRNHGFNSQSLLNQGRETRSLGLVALSRRARTYLNLHSDLQAVGSGGFFLISVISVDQ